MIKTTEKNFLNNFTTMANVINHIDEDGILKIERDEGDLIVISAEKFDQIEKETLSVLALLADKEECAVDCENCECKGDCSFEKMLLDAEAMIDEEILCVNCPNKKNCHKCKTELGFQ